ncbi:serine/threonine protein phosphatase [Clostridium botulinum]|uniref:serine/threonine protein phosphatase n=1 Tax=Clostridium botulinum TaxID=1491 RepID=UPI00099E0CE2|nr:serine/threonine protein phosphatase [Clostridium botulinum]NFA97375.1 serine/threonine protein phosphatase [Clostridium botulinum]NFB53121.1 serine/threonine protein phosphatase [Clostridium botulinum]NFC76575.1 serine/threonine protein phosphatase [Clostridium botulinum]NFC88207.1 serine/threonine protein phosphatase [Clostridium botulinum]NFD04447.1 serine/threonine protein phosphatase [Clostridium botulinum]
MEKTLYETEYQKGMYDFKNIRKEKLYVNTGIGNTKIPMRVGNIRNASIVSIKL